MRRGGVRSDWRKGGGRGSRSYKGINLISLVVTELMKLDERVDLRRHWPLAPGGPVLTRTFTQPFFMLLSPNESSRCTSPGGGVNCNRSELTQSNLMNMMRTHQPPLLVQYGPGFRWYTLTFKTKSSSISTGSRSWIHTTKPPRFTSIFKGVYGMSC